MWILQTYDFLKDEKSFKHYATKKVLNNAAATKSMKM